MRIFNETGIAMAKKTAPKKAAKPAKAAVKAAPKKAAKAAPKKAAEAPAKKVAKAAPKKASKAPVKKAAPAKAVAKKAASKVKAASSPVKTAVKKAAPKKSTAKVSKAMPSKKSPAAPTKAVPKAVPKKTAPAKAAAKPVAKAPATTKNNAPAKAERTDKRPAPVAAPKPIVKKVTKKTKAVKEPKAPAKPLVTQKVSPFRPTSAPTVKIQVSTLELTDRLKYNEEELKEFRDLINRKLDEARSDYDLLKKTLANTDNNGTDDTSPSFKMIEDGSETMSREETAQLAGRQEKFIKHLEDALLRVRNKTYGICRVTGRLISKERLRLVPHATLSIEAKQQMTG